jgi:hypothetical protein
MSSRKRAPNFTKPEKDSLISIVAQYKNIVENKKTDAVTCQEKTQAWFERTKKFNALSPGEEIHAPLYPKDPNRHLKTPFSPFTRN